MKSKLLRFTDEDWRELQFVSHIRRLNLTDSIRLCVRETYKAEMNSIVQTSLDPKAEITKIIKEIDGRNQNIGRGRQVRT